MMVKLVVFSDNHRDRSGIKKMLDQQSGYDHIFSLGDSEMPENELSDLGIIGVKGNYPFEPRFPYDLNMNFLGFGVFMTHGHHYNVKSGLSALYHHAQALECKLVLYGHTHMWSISDYGDVLLVNPGSLLFPKLHPERTYAVIKLLKNQIELEIIDVDSAKIIKNYTKFF
ncbi:MAG: YfcE family phosphodiesterase [Bacilli bacterium]|nr:YfcE family phosphodiesterase [Bacilli bacterium]